MRTPRRAPHGRVPFVLILVVVLLLFAGTTRPAGAAAADEGGWLRPVDGAGVEPFDAPSSPYAAGHRGVDFAAAPGTAARAANDGVVSFAGSVADTLHVTVAHTGGLRTSYSFLAGVSVSTGQGIARGDVLGTAGGTGPDHDGTV